MEYIRELFAKIDAFIGGYIDPVITKINEFLGSGKYTIIALIMLFVGIILLIGLIRWLRKSFKSFFFIAILFGLIIGAFYFLNK